MWLLYAFVSLWADYLGGMGGGGRMGGWGCSKSEWSSLEFEHQASPKYVANWHTFYPPGVPCPS